MKIASNTVAAEDAVSGFVKVEVAASVQRADRGSSNISSMVDGAVVANSILDRISELVSGVKAHAAGVSALATHIEERDKRDAGAWSEAR